MRKLKTVLQAALAVAVVSPVVFAHQVSAATWQTLYSSRWWNGTRLVSQVVTPDGLDLPYQIQEWNDNPLSPVPANQYDVKFTVPATNTGGNLREFVWPASTPDVMDSQSCAVWSKESEGFAQEGSAHRIVNTPTGTRGITVTKNIYYGASWILNVHVWDSSNTASPFTQIAGLDMSEVLGKFEFNPDGTLKSGPKPFPWRLCTRVVGNQLTLKVWTTEPTPAWDDPKFTRTVTIPDAWVQPGKTGWYIGHLRPGQTVEYQNIYTHAFR